MFAPQGHGKTSFPPRGRATCPGVGKHPPYTSSLCARGRMCTDSLSVARAIVERTGGEILSANVPGCGMCASVRWPLSAQRPGPSSTTGTRTPSGIRA
ncbi:MAG: hypothetical protein BLITH_1500 [Brockia lithotrophica]|uniref:Uncharacterized protein n=1 Tax=Brockia lithotrophica TaxID=933949 RepID=A0A2T5G5I0_9BACL|nr:MAG: hypothetical protein BLITH_1500 [Brockia lithotrophica]